MAYKHRSPSDTASNQVFRCIFPAITELANAGLIDGLCEISTIAILSIAPFALLL
jgi:hypothetical protein